MLTAYNGNIVTHVRLTVSSVWIIWVTRNRRSVTPMVVCCAWPASMRCPSGIWRGSCQPPDGWRNVTGHNRPIIAGQPGVPMAFPGHFPCDSSIRYPRMVLTYQRDRSPRIGTDSHGLTRPIGVIQYPRGHAPSLNQGAFMFDDILPFKPTPVAMASWILPWNPAFQEWRLTWPRQPQLGEV